MVNVPSASAGGATVGVRDQFLPVVGKVPALRRLVHQPAADGALQCRDPPRHRRVLDSEPMRRVGDPTGAGQREQVEQIVGAELGHPPFFSPSVHSCTGSGPKWRSGTPSLHSRVLLTWDQQTTTRSARGGPRRGTAEAEVAVSGSQIDGARLLLPSAPSGRR